MQKVFSCNNGNEIFVAITWNANKSMQILVDSTMAKCFRFVNNNSITRWYPYHKILCIQSKRSHHINRYCAEATSKMIRKIAWNDDYNGNEYLHWNNYYVCATFALFIVDINLCLVLAFWHGVAQNLIDCFCLFSLCIHWTVTIWCQCYKWLCMVWHHIKLFTFKRIQSIFSRLLSQISFYLRWHKYVHL